MALLLIDVINDFDFPESDAMLPTAVEAARRIAELKERAETAGIPAIYVNDNFGRWRSDFKAQIEHCLSPKSKGKEIVRQLIPKSDDYFVLKPKHSGFYSTNLELLLEHLEIDTLILTGFAGNICVMFTANDAYMRNYKWLSPKIARLQTRTKKNRFAFRQMQQLLKANTSSSITLEF